MSGTSSGGNSKESSWGSRPAGCVPLSSAAVWPGIAGTVAGRPRSDLLGVAGVTALRMADPEHWEADPNLVGENQALREKKISGRTRETMMER